MEVENIGIPVILQDLMHNGDDAKRNSISVIPQEDEPNGSDSTSHSTDLTQEMESKAGVITSNPIPMIQQGMDPNSDMMGPDGDDMETNDENDTDDIGGNAIPVVSKPNADDIRRSSIGETDGVDIQSNSMPVIIQEVESNAGDVRRNTIAGIPQEMEQESGDIRRNSILVIPVGIEANGADIRRRSIARNIQSRYLRASTGSCHDYCKYGMRRGCEDENLVSSPSAERKRRTTTINSKSSPDSLVTEKRVIPMTKKGTPTPKKVSSLLKEVDAPMEDSFVAEKSVVSVTKKGRVSLESENDVTMEDMDLDEDGEQVEHSVPLGPIQRLSTLKVISTISPKPSEDPRTKKLNITGVSEKRSLSLAKRETVSSKMASTSFKETDVSTIDSKLKPEKPEKSSLSASASSLRNPKVISRGDPKPSKNETSSFKEIGVSVEDQGSSNKGHGGTRKSKEVPDVSSSTGNTSIKNNNRRTSLPGEKRTTGIQTVSLSSKHSSRRDFNISTGNSYNLKGLSHLKDQSDPGKSETRLINDKDMPEKVLYVIESSTENTVVQSTPDGVPKPSASSALPSEGESKRLKYARKGIGRAGSSPSSEKNLKRVNGAHSQSTGPLHQDNKGLRRTHHGTQASLSPSPSSSSMSVASIESTQNKEDGANSQRETIKSGKPTGNMKAHHKTTPRRSAIDGSGSKTNVSRKLTFRRGRVVELQPENNTPRRLKFRRVRLAVESPTSKGTYTSGSIGKKEVDENQSTFGGFIKRASNLRKAVIDRQSNDAARIKRVSNVRKDVGDRQSNAVVIKRVVSTGKKEVNDGQSNGAKVKSERVVLRNQEHVEVSPRKSSRRKPVIVGPLNGLRSNTEKVVLRHRDVNGKKDDRKLFNNVIEETASKLVETRKSKVKALVGAFETVISLQDKRQVAATVNA